MHTIETNPQKITIGDHRFEVWVRVIVEIAETDVARTIHREETLRENSDRYRPYDETRGNQNISYSILNGATVGVRYLGPVDENMLSVQKDQAT